MNLSKKDRGVHRVSSGLHPAHASGGCLTQQAHLTGLGDGLGAICSVESVTRNEKTGPAIRRGEGAGPGNVV